MKLPILSVIIHTKNAAQTVERALKSVAPIADEIVVVDMHSNDNTAAIAKKFGATVISHKDVGYADPARNFGLTQTRGAWIFVLDADEFLEPETRTEIQKILAGDTSLHMRGDCYFFPRKNIIWGDWVRCAGWWPDHQLRLFRRGQAQWSGKVHEIATSQGRCVKLPSQQQFAIVHDNYPTVESYITRMNTYTTLEHNQKDGANGLIDAFFSEFERRLLGLNGIDGGTRGVALSLFQGMYSALTKLKDLESQHFPGQHHTARKVFAQLDTMERKLQFWKAHYHMMHTRFPLNLYWRIRRKLNSLYA